MWYVPHYIHIQYTEFGQMTPNTKPDRARDCSSAICLGNRIRAKIFLRTYIPAHYLSLFISCPSFLEHSLRSSSILYAFIPSLTSPITVRHPVSWIICANQSSCNILPYRFFFLCLLLTGLIYWHFSALLASGFHPFLCQTHTTECRPPMADVSSQKTMVISISLISIPYYIYVIIYRLKNGLWNWV